ncbi:hypothetical protein HMPREF0591_5739 [Mycobacterium parascrofulaceum ATCC BAA-614]|uniref:Uncharacterized protein n=1 Tax=Mycobacterium parascrofulaceum ATCC BAA-614 TaxID=525368 RepID=D5PHU5_9MYCO|nr:hypothetical protein HMPREF0591_5739 [Mycobacterium parascrofulaceum ATCC BAA-614]
MDGFVISVCPPRSAWAARSNRITATLDIARCRLFNRTVLQPI